MIRRVCLNFLRKSHLKPTKYIRFYVNPQLKKGEMSFTDQKPEETIFAKMARGEIKPNVVYEDDKVLVFKDINPVAPTHLLIISKQIAIGQCHEATEEQSEALGYLFYIAGKVAKQEKIPSYRLVINQGADAGQTVNYLHVHLLAGRKMAWPPG